FYKQKYLSQIFLKSNSGKKLPRLPRSFANIARKVIYAKSRARSCPKCALVLKILVIYMTN
ncbi:hypothetical protein, partial [Brenneria alni]|uniref:hypothetical protein n=1 Tax=Brenneria alni TaxID=71656 RepID=UPI00196B790E